jgi:hypothetical protein
MVRLPGLGGVFMAAALCAAFPSLSLAATDGLSSLYRQILAQPDNIELNLRYAREAEAAGKPRWALAAYERILLAHPDNADAKLGQMRIRRLLTPDRTSFETRFGIAFESNPRLSTPPSPANGEANGWARISMTDERHMGDTMWRSYGLLFGELHGTASELNYGYASFVTGPLIDGAGYTLHPTIGGGVAAFMGQLYFGEALAALGVEGNFNRALQTARFRVGYRGYGASFPADQGFYADLTGRWTIPDVAGTGGTFTIAPWARWSGIPGDGFDNVNFVTVVPGKYAEVGGRLEFVQPVADKVAVAANFEVNQRWYTVDPRQDLRLAPGAAVIFKNAFSYGNDVRLDYQFVDNTSTDPTHSYLDHIVTLQLINRY